MKHWLNKHIRGDMTDDEYRQWKDNQPASSKPALSFEGKEKQLVLNPTNTKTLCSAYGDDSDGWIGHEIGLTVADYTDKGFGHGWIVKPLDIKEPDFDDDIPF